MGFLGFGCSILVPNAAGVTMRGRAAADIIQDIPCYSLASAGEILAFIFHWEVNRYYPIHWTELLLQIPFHKKKGEKQIYLDKSYKNWGRGLGHLSVNDLAVS